MLCKRGALQRALPFVDPESNDVPFAALPVPDLHFAPTPGAIDTRFIITNPYLIAIEYKKSHKLRILAEIDECTRPGQLGALLRREGLYSSTVRRWRQRRDEGVLIGLSPKKRGPKPNPDAVLVRELAKQKKRNDQLEKELQRAEMIIGVQKKVSELLGITLGETNEQR